MATNSQLSTSESKKNKQKARQTTKTESQKWKSHGGLSVQERGREGKGTENK